MGIARYLIQFSYVGTRYYGVQKQKKSIEVRYDNSVQTAIEMGLNELIPTPVDEMKSGISSRTDRSVHSFGNTFVMDLRHPIPDMIYSPDVITSTLNKFFVENDHLIIAKNSRIVPTNFDISGNAVWRQYVYRVAFSRGQVTNSGSHEDRVPILDLDVINIIRPQKLDINSIQKACDMFVGTQDFRSFECIHRDKTAVLRQSVRNLSVFSFTPYNLKCGSYFDACYDKMDFYEFCVRADGFLYKQVRRMVGCALSVGMGRMQLSEIKYLLDHPDRKSWRMHYETAHPSALIQHKMRYKFHQ